jgi:hypothetical protein
LVLALRRQAKPIVTVGAVALCLIVWIARRPEQLTRPYVWDEEAVVLKDFIESGWAAALTPVQGYLVLPSSPLLALGAQISLTDVPTTSYISASLVFVVTVVMLVVPDSRWGDLKIRAAMAITMALVPTNPEVFGVLLYSFWWSTLWPLIILGWKRSLWAIRVPLLAIAALSSPAGGALFVLFFIAYALWRRRHDLISGAILLAGLVVEIVVFFSSTRAETIRSPATAVAEQVLRTGGYFETQWLPVGQLDRGLLALAGLLFLAFLAGAGIYLAASVGRPEALLLTLAALLFTGLSAVPAPLISHPVVAGPRYFFLPFVAFAWALLLIVRDARQAALRIAAALLLCVSLLNLKTTFLRLPQTTTANLSWEAELRKCALSRSRIVHVPIYFDGAAASYFSLDLTPDQCRK